MQLSELTKQRFLRCSALRAREDSNFRADPLRTPLGLDPFWTDYPPLSPIGTTKNPAMGRVQTEERAFEVLAFCQDHGIQLLIEVAPDQPEDISDVDRALVARQPAVAVPKIGRNEPCPCGSGKKFKKCCGGSQPQTAS